MKPELNNGHIRAFCPDCKSITTFECSSNRGNYGQIHQSEKIETRDGVKHDIYYFLYRCAGCGRGGFAKIFHPQIGGRPKIIDEFAPVSISKASLPSETPEDIKTEFREAELCHAYKANRAASAMVRSTLEKTLKANGYTSGNLVKKIDDAVQDGVLTAARGKRAHEEIRVLGNNVLHDDWVEISEDDVSASLKYAALILLDFYDDRDTVVELLTEKGRTIVPESDEIE